VAESQAKNGKCCRLPRVGPNFNLWPQQIESGKQHSLRSVAHFRHSSLRLFDMMMPESNIGAG
jgi:hypothetical protein